MYTTAGQPITIADRVYQGLRSEIISGSLKPGTRLVQREVAQRFGTSNIPVIEAIRRLEHDCLLVVHANWGSRVKEWTLEDVEGLFLLREAVDTSTGRLFAERATAVERATLVEMGRQFDTLARARAEEAMDEADAALHRHIFQCARSPTLNRLTENIHAITVTIANTLELGPLPGPMGPPGAHDELIAALVRGDAAGAEQATRDHVRWARDRIFKAMRAKPRGRGR